MLKYSKLPIWRNHDVIPQTYITSVVPYINVNRKTCFTKVFHEKMTTSPPCFCRWLLTTLVLYGALRRSGKFHFVLFDCCIFNTDTSCNNSSLMSRNARRFCLITTSYKTRSLAFFILLHVWHNYVCFGELLYVRTLCDVYYKELASH